MQVLWAAGGQAPPGGLAGVLPAFARTRGTAKASAARLPASRVHTTSVLEVDCLQEAGAPNEAPAPEEAQLRIAWQYRRYIRRQQAEREAAAHPSPDPSPVPARPPGTAFVRKGASPGPSPAPGGAIRAAGSSASGSGGRLGTRDAGAARRWCHDFDLTQPMAEETLRGASTVRTALRSEEEAWPLLISSSCVSTAERGQRRGALWSVCSAGELSCFLLKNSWFGTWPCRLTLSYKQCALLPLFCSNARNGATVALLLFAPGVIALGCLVHLFPHECTSLRAHAIATNFLHYDGHGGGSAPPTWLPCLAASA